MKYRAVLAACLAVSVLGVTACNGKKARTELLTIPAAGSSFVFPAMQRWSEDFFELHRPTQVDYVSVGSVAAVQRLAEGKVAFAATDFALTPQQLTALPPVLQIPEIGGAICITYNLPSVKQPLRLSPQALAGIYLGTITKWNDPVLEKDNPGIPLPDHKITVVHRVDPAGATSIFTTYLSAVSKKWKSTVGAGDSVKWPAGIGGVGSQGLTSVVRNSPDSIGFVELNYAQQNELPTAAIENQAGRYIQPTVASTQAAVNAFVPQITKNLNTLIVDPSATASGAYPIAGLNFMIVPIDGTNVTLRKALQKFIYFVLHNGQDTAYHISYAPLPEGLKQYDENQLKLMEINGKRIQ